MHNCYKDILERIPEPPQWFDEHAVPRYCPFGPGETANIYANTVVLARITCQGCGHEFEVCFSESSMDRVMHQVKYPDIPYKSLADLIQDQTLHYGDPPNVGCCGAGASMNSEPRAVLQYWHRRDFEWKRDHSLEVKIIPEWVKE